MVMSHRKYVREQKAKSDEQQATLNPKNPSFIQHKKQIEVNIAETFSATYRCPFCLGLNKINAYLISTKKGYNKGLGHCPECNNKMQLKTLTAEMTPEQFAEFAFGYSSSGYWQKVPFSKFNSRLKLIGWLERFWNEYRKLKGDSDKTENYQDYISRVQEEEARAQGLIE